jgi:hypothetical protein
MELVVEMGSVTMAYIPSFIKIRSGIQNLIREGWIHRHKESMVISKANFYFFKLRKLGQK